ncbi:sigma-54-dependent Fis family transcriptional regulator, partial [candidate division KSB1 bacterium]
DTRDLLREYFSSLDYYVEVCSNGIEALKILEKEEFTILITDIRMPEMDGITLIKNVKKRFPKLGVIMMTAFSSIYGEKNVRKIGIDDYIAKPFKFDEITEKVERIVSQISMIKPKEKEKNIDIKKKNN